MIKLVLLTALLASAHCKVFNNCELARTLVAYGLPKHQIPTWVCIAFKESSYNTAAINWGSQCYGLFQINTHYWCNRGWVGCGIACSSLLDDNIYDDVQCVKTVFNEFQRLRGNGFYAWETYPACSNYNTAQGYVSGCWY